MNKLSSESATPKKLRILWADDDDQLKAYLGNAIRREFDVELSLCEDGTEALKQGAVFLPELVILDGNMPEMSGMKACQEMRQTAWGSKIPIILHSGLNFTDHELEEFGFTFFVSKFGGEDLMMTLRELQIPTKTKPEGTLMTILNQLRKIVRKS